MTAAIVWVYLFDFTQLFSRAKKKCSRRALTRDLHCLLSREPDQISAQTLGLYCQKLEICPAKSMYLSLLVFMQLFFESRTVVASQIGAKTEFNH